MFGIKVLALWIILTNIQPYLVNSVEFDQEYVGINFSPYVKTAGSKSVNPCLVPYTLTEVSAMLRVVATKFTRVSIDSVGASNAGYIPNITYYDSPCIIGRTAELAALINKERNKKSLSVLIGIMTYDNDKHRTKAEFKIALDAVKIANALYPGTVEGLQVFLKPTVLNDSKVAQTGVNWIRHLRQRTNGLSMKIGAFTVVEDFNFFDLSQYTSISWKRDNPRSNLLQSADFFNFKVFPIPEMMSNGPNQTFLFLGGRLKTYGVVVKAVNTNLQLFGSTGWSTEGNHIMQNTKNMLFYWRMINEFASKAKITVWLHEAFDNPWKRNLKTIDSSHYGWWRLTDDKRANDESVYVQKILQIPDESSNDSEYPFNLPTWVSGGVAAAVIVILLLVGLVMHAYRNINFLQQILTDEEIAEFKFGSSDTSVYIAEYDNPTCNNAMKKPYDQRLEISKNMLEIYWNQILGAGQFGSVHKAILKGPSLKDVALKTAKPDCPTNALIGLLSEIKILAHLGQHPNIVSICGAYTSELRRNKVFVVLELCQLGSLKNHLMELHTRKYAFGVNEDDVDSFLEINLLRWSCEIASGMEHLGLKGVVHADLATRNVLLNSEGTAKIADFGLSRRLYEYSEYVKKGQDPLPWKWMAPESLKLNKFSCQSDVWSYGVTLWEIFSLGAEPYPGRSCNTEFTAGLENGSGIMNQPIEANAKLYQVMLDCWNVTPELRPTFGDLKTRILEIRNEDIYMELHDMDT